MSSQTVETEINASQILKTDQLWTGTSFEEVTDVRLALEDEAICVLLRGDTRVFAPLTLVIVRRAAKRLDDFMCVSKVQNIISYHRIDGELIAQIDLNSENLEENLYLFHRMGYNQGRYDGINKIQHTIKEILNI